VGCLAGCEPLEIGPEEQCGSTHRRSAPLSTSRNQPDGKAQAGFGLVVMPLCSVNRETLQSLLQNNTGQRGQILPQTFPPSHCTHRETTLALQKPGPSGGAQWRHGSFSSPSPLGCSRLIVQKCWAGSAQCCQRFQSVSPHTFPLCKISTGKN